MFDFETRQRVHAAIGDRVRRILAGESDEAIDAQLSALSLALIAERLESCSERHTFNTTGRDL